jgi:hypothetical protein
MNTKSNIGKAALAFLKWGSFLCIGRRNRREIEISLSDLKRDRRKMLALGYSGMNIRFVLWWRVITTLLSFVWCGLYRGNGIIRRWLSK